jgi:hypothetical protein
MKGWRPSATKGLSRIGPFQADVFLPDIGSIGLSFPLLGPRAWAARSPHVRLNQTRGRQVGQMASKRSRSKWRQPFPCFMRPVDPETKMKEERHRGVQAAAPLPQGRF